MASVFVRSPASGAMSCRTQAQSRAGEDTSIHLDNKSSSNMLAVSRKKWRGLDRQTPAIDYFPIRCNAKAGTFRRIKHPILDSQRLADDRFIVTERPD